MRQYNCEQEREIIKIQCNVCKKELKVKNGMLLEGGASFSIPWDYFSEKDGQVHHFDLCEECYNKWITSFQVPVSIEEQNELI